MINSFKKKNTKKWNLEDGEKKGISWKGYLSNNPVSGSNRWEAGGRGGGGIGCCVVSDHFASVILKQLRE